MGRYRVTPGSSSFNSSSRDTRPQLSSGNLTLLETISYRARNDALTASDRDKLKSLVSALGYKIDRIPLSHRDKIRNAQKAVSASMQRVAAKQAKGQAQAEPPKLDKDGLPPLTMAFHTLPMWRQEMVLKEREALRKSRLSPQQRAHENVGDAIKTLKGMHSQMRRMLNGYSVSTSYRGVRGSTSKALDVVLKELPQAAENAIKAVKSYHQEHGKYEDKTVAAHEKSIRKDQQELFDAMKAELLPHLDATQAANFSLPASTSVRETVDFKSTAKAEFSVPLPRPR